jgi:PKD repeat protein
MTVFGSGENDYTDTWTYDAASDSWAPNRILPGAIRTASAGVFDPVTKRLLVFGGRDAAGDCLDEVWAFSAGTLGWTYFSPGYMQPPPLGGDDYPFVTKVSWTADVPARTNITLRMRVSDDNATWSIWEAVENGGKPQAQGRYVQWNMTFTSSPDLLQTPVLKGVRFDYTVNERPQANAAAQGTGFKRQAVQLAGGGTDADGDALTFKWSKDTTLAGFFDDDALHNATYTPLQSGVHRLSLVVNDSFELSPPVSVNITVANRPPSAMAGRDLSGWRGEYVNLFGEGSDPDGDALFYNWTQLEGPPVEVRTPTSPNASFIPPRSGNYTFRLEISDGEDAASASVNVTVLNRPPVARLEAAPLRAGVNERINFSAALSYDPDGNVTKYFIDFGDGNDTGWTAKPAIGYYYTAPGVYNATARVLDDEGALSGPAEPVTITVANALPVVNTSVSPSAGDIRTRFQFTVAASSHDPDGSIVAYSWRFGDGATESGSSVSHNYSRPGTYTVVLRATDDLGGFTEVNLTVVVANLAPVITSTSPARLYAMKARAAATFTVGAADPEGGPLAYTWKVDNATAGGNNNTFVFQPASKGSYRVTVTVSDGELGATYEWGVTASAAGGTGGGEEGFPMAAAVIVIVVAALVAVIVLLARKKK